MTAQQIALTCGVVLLLVALWVMQKSRHPFNLADTLMDPATGRASLNAVILMFMALLAAWVVVDREGQGLDDVPNLLMGVLGIFVIGRVGAQAITAFKPSPDASSSVKETVRETVVTTPLKDS